MAQVAGALGQLRRHAMGKAVEQRVVVHQALNQRDRARLCGAGRLNRAVKSLHIGNGSTVLPRRNVNAVHASGNIAHQHAGHAIDAIGGDDLARRRVIVNRSAIAFKLQHQHIQVALDHGMDLTARILKL